MSRIFLSHRRCPVSSRRVGSAHHSYPLDIGGFTDGGPSPPYDEEMPAKPPHQAGGKGPVARTRRTAARTARNPHRSDGGFLSRSSRPQDLRTPAGSNGS